MDTDVSGFAGAGIVAVSAATNGNSVAIKNSVFSGNSVAGVEGDAGSHVSVNSSTITHNNIGVQSSSSVRVHNNDISYNNTAFSGAVGTSGLNRYDSNVSPGTAPGAPADIGP